MGCDVCEGDCRCGDDDLIPDKMAFQVNKR